MCFILNKHKKNFIAVTIACIAFFLTALCYLLDSNYICTIANGCLSLSYLLWAIREYKNYKKDNNNK